MRKSFLFPFSGNQFRKFISIGVNATLVFFNTKEEDSSINASESQWLASTILLIPLIAILFLEPSIGTEQNDIQI